MKLTTEELGDVPDVNAAVLDETLASDAFGKFAVLSASDDRFIQAGNDWQPGEACRAFMQAHDSDPWLLEYREGGPQFRAIGHVTQEQVRQAFRSYLAGGTEWRTGFAWREIQS
ncbi:MAG: hypothetical protein JNM56_30250 [Planctomycetia bacterium]|nr:hypothetical protein [Planctomycetia bacterium]